MAENEKDTSSSADLHDGPDAGDTSQGEPGGTDGETSSSAPAEGAQPEPSVPADTNEGADSRATIVEPGGQDPSPRA